jgi:hypothetical protein
MPVPQRMSNSASVNGGAHLFLTTLTRVDNLTKESFVVIELNSVPTVFRAG